MGFYLIILILQGKGHRTNKLMAVLPVSVVKLWQTYFSVLCQFVPLHKCNITYCKCNIAWVLSLCNTSWLNTKITGFEILPLVLLYLTRSRCINFKTLKLSTLLFYSIFFFHFKPFYNHFHSKFCFPGPESLDLNAFKTFAFFFLKLMHPYFFCISPR